MATTIKKQAEKQATKITRKTIQHANDAAKETVDTEKGDFLKRIEESALASETEGRDAFTNLRRLRGGSLQPGEEVVIARHLHTELSVLKRHLRARNMGLGAFCGQFGLADASESSKELHRLTLPQGKSPMEVRLRRSADKYRRLIEGISKITKESMSTLADRVLRGTSLHPSQQTDGMTETEKVHAVLQGIVDKIDREFGLHAKFVEIAELKARHIANGGKEHWPLWKPISPHDQTWRSDFDIPIEESDIQDYERELASTTDQKYAFWKCEFEHPPVDAQTVFDELFPGVDSSVDLAARIESPSGQFPSPPDSGAIQDSDFFYVPHAPLGVIEFANIPRRHNSPGKYEEAVRSRLEWWRTIDKDTGLSWVAREYSVSDDWDADKACPVGQLDFSDGRSRGTDFAWLIIYPTRDGSRLMPMIYIAYQEGGPYILPLDARSLEVFRDAIWFDETRHLSVFDRIKELLGYRAGAPRVIEDGFRRTAPWLDYNPFFKMRQQHRNDLQMLDAFCNELWEEK